MFQDLRFPVGLELPDGQRYKRVVHADVNWQIIETEYQIRYLVFTKTLSERWLDSGLVRRHTLTEFSFGDHLFEIISAGDEQRMDIVSSPKPFVETIDAIAFALALKETRAIARNIPLQDAIYVEKLSRLLPTFSLTTAVSDEVLLGNYLTGGVNVSVKSYRRFRQLVGSKFTTNELAEILEAGGFEIDSKRLKEHENSNSDNKNRFDDDEYKHSSEEDVKKIVPEIFNLPGRPELTEFFNEHVIEVIKNRERYAQLGIDFPSAIVLHGPPGTGKTFAVDQLVEFLGWPSFNIDATSIGSPYIHETGRKIAQIFDLAIDSSPSVLIIDEMEAFLASRKMNAGHHQVEELAEFLRKIPEAVKNDVLIVSMTNRIDMVDQAILRRGRFDHIIEVGYANQEDVKELLDARLSEIPSVEKIDTTVLARKLSGRPLSDVDFVLRDAARLAVRSEKDRLDYESLTAAVDGLEIAHNQNENDRKIGFV